MRFNQAMVLPWSILLCLGVVMTANSVQAQVLSQNTTDTSKPPSQPLLIQEVGLTQAQVEKLEAIQKQSSAQIVQVKEKLDQAEQELDTLLTSATASESQVREKYRQLETLRQNFSNLIFESKLAVRSVLSPEQRLAFERQMQKLGNSR